MSEMEAAALCRYRLSKAESFLHDAAACRAAFGLIVRTRGTARCLFCFTCFSPYPQAMQNKSQALTSDLSFTIIPVNERSLAT